MARLTEEEKRQLLAATRQQAPLPPKPATLSARDVVAFACPTRKADNKLYLPVVGPWMDLEHRDCDVNDCGDDTFGKVLLVGDRALQGIGALTLRLSFVIPESTKKPWYLIGDQNLTVAPQVGTGVTGLQAVGVF